MQEGHVLEFGLDVVHLPAASCVVTLFTHLEKTLDRRVKADHFFLSDLAGKTNPSIGSSMEPAADDDLFATHD